MGLNMVENETAEVFITVTQRTMMFKKGGGYKKMTPEFRAWLKKNIGPEEKSRFAVRYGKKPCWFPSQGYRKMLYGDQFSILTNNPQAAVHLKLVWSE